MSMFLLRVQCRSLSPSKKWTVILWCYPERAGWRGEISTEKEKRAAQTTNADPRIYLPLPLGCWNIKWMINVRKEYVWSQVLYLLLVTWLLWNEESHFVAPKSLSSFCKQTLLRVLLFTIFVFLKFLLTVLKACPIILKLLTAFFQTISL